MWMFAKFVGIVVVVVVALLLALGWAMGSDQPY
jgi:hypothetical protein